MQALSPKPGQVLAVDLDGTLIATDLLHEGVWMLLRRQPFGAVGLALALARGGRSGMKAWLAGRVSVDPATLPYRAPVLALVRDWRAKGGQAVLVTAADTAPAQAVAAHLGLFDAVHASRPGRNLKGPVKARFLVESFGAGGFVYVGDAAADLPVWAGAAVAVTVGAGAGLRARVAALGVPVLHLPGTPLCPGDAVLRVPGND